MARLTRALAGPSFRRAARNRPAVPAGMKQQLIEDEVSLRPLILPGLAARTQEFLSGAHAAMLLERAKEPVAYALFWADGESIALSQFFLVRRKHPRVERGRGHSRC